MHGGARFAAAVEPVAGGDAAPLIFAEAILLLLDKRAVDAAMIAELTCRQTLRAKRFERPWISSSALGCWKRSAPMARCWPGDAMLKLDPWRFASPSRASKRSG